jgi:myo-inositol-1(or 4)-monophosphatase
MAYHQLLHILIGGELKDLKTTEFRDLSKVELVGAYPNYAEARKAWAGKAQATVDNALMRYFIIHAHKLLDPSEPSEHGEDDDHH